VVEIILEILIQLVWEVLGQLMVELGWESLAHACRRKREANPILAGIGWVLVGAFSGGISAAIFPHRILPWARTPGISLLAAPIATGLLMKLLGDWRRQAGKGTTILATFWGGAIFAFAFSATRLFFVHGR
jgi:hypothetical protein